MDRTLRGLLPDELLTRVLGEVDVSAVVPGIGGRQAWDDVPAEDRASLLADAQKQASGEWPMLLAGNFARFHRDGDRVGYETPYFARRRRIALSTLAALLTGEDRWVADVVDGVWLVCDEATWTLPAHASSATNRGEALPRPGDRDLDLFCAETGGLLAWVDHLLGPVLEDAVRRRIAAEVDRRVLTPFLEIRDWVWLTEVTNNWNPWIHSNIIACALILEPDAARRATIVSLVVEGLDVFLDSYPDDGGCDEGALYWTRAGGFLADALVLLYDATDGQLDGFGHPKLGPITSYLPAMHINDRWYVNFADCPARLSEPSAAYPLYRLGVHTDEPTARQHARVLRDRDDTLVPQIPFMLRVLGTLLEPGLRATEDQQSKQDAWFPDTEVFVARSSRLLLALKGGHNAESHNHNDVGSLIVAVDGVPRVIDLGVGTYTRQTFSADRYQILTMQSEYHNLPIINGFAQLPGREFHATGMSAELGNHHATAEVDLARSYPPEAGIRSWHRELTLNRPHELIELTDTWEFDHPPHELLWHLMLHGPTTHNGNTIRVDDLTITFDPDAVTAELQPLQLTDPALSAIWGNHITRLVLTARPTHLTQAGTLTVTLKTSPAQ